MAADRKFVYARVAPNSELGSYAPRARRDEAPAGTTSQTITPAPGVTQRSREPPDRERPRPARAVTPDVFTLSWRMLRGDQSDCSHRVDQFTDF